MSQQRGEKRKKKRKERKKERMKERKKKKTCGTGMNVNILKVGTVEVPWKRRSVEYGTEIET